MNWWDYVSMGLTFVSAVCTFYSIKGAYNSNIYYKKSKQLTIYANTNAAYIEVKKIIATLTEMLKLANIQKKPGRNYIKAVSENGENIKNSINKIRESLTAEDCKEINQLLNSQQLKVENYIDSFVTGAVLVNESFVIDDDFNKCHEKFCEMQLLIKEKLETIGEKIK